MMRRSALRLPANALLAAWTVIIAIPVYIMIVSCFKTTQEIYRNPLALPESWDFGNFTEAWVRANFDVYTFNSVVVAVGAVLLTIVLAALASFPLSRLSVWWVTPVLGFFLIGLMIPVRLGSVEMFVLMKELSLLDSHLGLVLVYAAIRLPFAILIMSSFMRAVPKEFEDAARIDGAGDLRLLFSVLLPQIKPAVGIVAIFTTIAVWNDFFFPLMFIFDPDLRTLPLGLASFTGEYSTNWGLLFAGLTISTLPLTLAYVVLSRQVREGVGAGGIK